MTRRAVAAAVGALLVAAVTVAAAAPAEAAAYRFWSYWKVVNGAWTFSQVGASAPVVDGAVEGWRFSVSPDSSNAPRPRWTAETAFAAICAATAPQPDHVRVAVVIDYGSPDHAPSGQHPPTDVTGFCATLPTSPRPTGFAALDFGTDYHSQSGLLCSITGYPQGECGVVVDTPAPPTPNPPPAAAPAPPPPPSSAAPPAASSTSPRAAAPPTASSTAPTPNTDTSTPPPPNATPPPSVAAPSTSTSASGATPDPSSEEERSSLAPVPVASRDTADGGPPVGLLVGAVLVAGLAAGAWWQTRRRGGSAP